MLLETELSPTIPIQKPLNKRCTNKLIKKNCKAYGMVSTINLIDTTKIALAFPAGTSLLKIKELLQSLYP